MLRNRQLLVLLAVCVPVLVAAFARQEEGAALPERFEALFAAKDHAGAVALFREHAGQALPFLDGYLEGSLAKIEDGSEKPGSEALRALHERASFGAHAADEALSTVLLGDYVSSFVGWDAEQQARFRGGQKAFGEHRAAMRAGKHEEALAKAIACREAAEPLGDWWGTAMGLGGEGAALLALGRAEEALVPLARARLVNHELGLAGPEYGATRQLVDACIAAGRPERAEAAGRAALALAERLGDAEGRAALQKSLDALDGAGD